MSAPCADCARDVMELGEYSYMVKREVWAQAAPDDPRNDTFFLCIACLEARLGRQLNLEDFNPAVPLNFYPWSDSPLLADRKTGLVQA